MLCYYVCKELIIQRLYRVFFNLRPKKKTHTQTFYSIELAYLFMLYMWFIQETIQLYINNKLTVT